ncbi:MAG: hypothetical protein ABI606_19160 [Rhodoferax sp.]
MNQIETLQALLNDVKGNEFMRDAKKVSGYLKSISLLADAMARRSWQQFELDVIDEINEVKGSSKIADALDIKIKLANREFELADLQVKLMDFHARAASSVYCTKEDAANDLRKIADDIASKDSELFPKPWTEEDFKAYAASIGATYIDNSDDFESALEKKILKSKNQTSISKTRKPKPVAN